MKCEDLILLPAALNLVNITSESAEKIHPKVTLLITEESSGQLRTLMNN